MARNKKNLWIVVKVESGIPVKVDIFQKQRDADRRQEYLRNGMNPENDETGIFKVTKIQ